MPRLVTFGCSFTYGHGLHDCFSYDKEPSMFAWPQLLADKLTLTCVNKSKPGSGNFEILLNVLTTDFCKDDMVIISFSYFERYNLLKMSDNSGNRVRIPFKTSNHKTLVLNEFEDVYSKPKLYWDNWLAIHHCEKFLISKKIRNFSFFGTPYGARSDKPDILELENFIYDITFISKDKALDRNHPGPDSHRLLSNIIYEKITT